MNRSVLFTLPLIIASSTTAIAEEAKKIDPAKQGPTDAVTDAVPDMKSAPATKGDKAEGRPATKSVDESVPPMKPGDAPSKNAGGTTKPAPPDSKAVE